MRIYQPGDKVRILQFVHPDFVIGEIYTVKYGGAAGGLRGDECFLEFPDSSKGIFPFYKHEVEYVA